MIAKLKDLQAGLQRKHNNSVINLETFPSDAAVLDVQLNGLLFIFEYLPHEGFAVSKIETEEDAWDPGKCLVFKEDEFEMAWNYLLTLLNDENSDGQEFPVNRRRN